MNLAEWAYKWGVPVAAMQELRTMYQPDNLVGVEPIYPERSEQQVQTNIRILAPRFGFQMWRNNSGALQDADGRWVRFGLGNISKRLNAKWKSADLCGIGPNARFMAVECKEPGWSGPRTDEETAQMAMLNQVNALGGIGIFATSSQDYVKALQ